MFVLKHAFSCHLNFLTTPREDISGKKSKIEILVLFLFYSPGYKQVKDHYHQKDVDIKKDLMKSLRKTELHTFLWLLTFVFRV